MLLIAIRTHEMLIPLKKGFLSGEFFTFFFPLKDGGSEINLTMKLERFNAPDDIKR